MTDRVVRLSRADLDVDAWSWPFAQEHSVAIERHWERRLVGNPAFFNGPIHLAHKIDLDADTLAVRCLMTDFKSYLYWRETGFSDRSVRDAFGSALLRSAEGHILLGRQRDGINAGLAYLPGGFIDGRDVNQDGRIDIEASICRELAEETGLAAATLSRVPGYLATFSGPLLSIAIEFRSSEPAAALSARIRSHLAADPDAELADIVVVEGAGDLVDLAMPSYARTLLGALFEGGIG